MRKFKVYDETHPVQVVKDGVTVQVPFCELKEGDQVADCYTFVCGSDAHLSGDSDYDGYLVFSTTGTGYFPEDFGAKIK